MYRMDCVSKNPSRRAQSFSVFFFFMFVLIAGANSMSNNETKTKWQRLGYVMLLLFFLILLRGFS